MLSILGHNGFKTSSVTRKNSQEFIVMRTKQAENELFLLQTC